MMHYRQQPPSLVQASIRVYSVPSGLACCYPYAVRMYIYCSAVIHSFVLVQPSPSLFNFSQHVPVPALKRSSTCSYDKHVIRDTRTYFAKQKLLEFVHSTCCSKHNSTYDVRSIHRCRSVTAASFHSRTAVFVYYSAQSTTPFTIIEPVISIESRNELHPQADRQAIDFIFPPRPKKTRKRMLLTGEH